MKVKGGLRMYLDIYKWFTETSGLGLTEQAGKLMNPAPAKSEGKISECIEQWEEKCNRLARYGSELQLNPIFKIVALRKILVGEALRDFDLWKSENMAYEKMLAKINDYARNKKLDGDAASGKPAVDVGRVSPNEGQDGEET